MALTRDLPSGATTAARNSSADITARVRALEGPGLRSFVHDTPFVIEKANGSHVVDADGGRYLDLSGFHGVGNIGHAHPAVVEAVSRQAAELIHCPTSYLSKARAEAYEAIASIAPPALDAIIPQPSGALANEIALLIARNRRPEGEVIAFAGGYHGRTVSTAPVAGKTQYRSKLGLHAGAQFVPYPRESAAGPSTDSVMALLETLVAPGGGVEAVSAVILEAVQGNGGVVTPPLDFLKRLRAFCDRVGALLIIDEVQAGFGRTGTMWAFDHSGVVPDVMTIGKGIAGGLPMAAVVARRDHIAWAPDTIAGTFLVNNMLLAAVTASIGVLKSEQLVERSAKLGEKYFQILRQRVQGLPGVIDVRGRGLWLAVELGDRQGSPAQKAGAIAESLRRDGVIIGTGGYVANVVKLAPALNIGEDDLAEGVEKFISAVSDYSQSVS